MSSLHNINVQQAALFRFSLCPFALWQIPPTPKPQQRFVLPLVDGEVPALGFEKLDTLPLGRVDRTRQPVPESL